MQDELSGRSPSIRTLHPCFGSLDAKLRVDASGALDYRIDLAVPPGTGGVQPDLSLAYNSRFRNGTVGVGWRLRGLSVVTRVGATMAVDAFIGGVTYTANDRFAVDGMRLIATSGRDGENGTIYRKQIDSWSQVTSNGSAGSGPESFVVRTKDGRTMEYGTDPSSRIMDPNRQGVRVWALSKVTDAHGNAMSITYALDPNDPARGAYYPETIEYMSNAGTGLSATRSVRFNWESRTDSYAVYQAGSAIQVALRLASIETSVSGRLVSRYALAYQYGSVSGSSLLASVTWQDGDGNALVPTTFTWQQASGTFKPVTQLGVAPIIPWYATAYPMDVNGDGLTDVVFVWAAGGFLNYGVAISDGTALRMPGAAVATNLPYYGSTPGLQPVDVDGNGCVDLFYGYQTADFKFVYSILLSDGEGGFAVQPPVPTAYPATNLPMVVALDVDGDGRGDIVFASAASTFPNPTLQYVVFKSQATVPPSYDAGVQYPTSLTCWTGFPALSPANINGDQMTDLVYGFIDQNNGFSVVHLISNGASFEPGTPISVVAAGTFVDDPIAMPMDINGDGLHDVLVTWMDSTTTKGLTGFLFSDGRGLQGPVAPGPAFPSKGALMPVDVDGDGRTDLLYAGPDGNNNLSLQVYKSNGTGFADPLSLPATTIPYNQYTTVPLGLQGCGKSDLLNDQQPAGSGTTFNAWLADPKAVDLLIGIQNGYGGMATVAYQPLTNASVYQPARPSTGQLDASRLLNRVSGSVYPMGQTGKAVGTPGVSYPIVNFVAPVCVVSSLTRDDRNGTTNTISCTYQGALLDLNRNQWLGFGQTSQRSSDTGLDTITAYAQEFPLTGLTTSCSLQDPKKQRTVSATHYQYTITQTVPGNAKVVLVARSRQRADHYEAGVYEYSIGVALKTDVYGNVTVRTDQGYVDRSGKVLDPASVVYTLKTYVNDQDAWRFDLPLVTWTTTNAHADPTCVSPESKPDFSAADESLRIVGYSDDGRYDVTAQYDWDDANARWSRVTFTVDRYGNRTSVKNSAGSTWTTSYDATYQTFPTIRTAPRIGKTSLTTHYGFDPRFGKRVAEADANGNVKITALDGFGRVAAEQVTAPALPGIVPSTNLFPLLATGTFDFARASVVTLIAQTWGRAPSGFLYESSDHLQVWPTTKVQDTVWTRAYKDGFGRTILKATQGDPAKGDVIRTYRLDSSGRILVRSLPFFGSADACLAGDRAARAAFTYAFDLHGRYARTTFPVGADGSVSCIKTFAYSQQCQTVVYAEGDPAEFTERWQYRYYKSKARLVSIVGSSGANARTYAYDPFGRMRSITDAKTASNPSGVANTITHDSLGRRLSFANPDMGTIKDTYGLSGKPISRVTPAGTFRYVYDALGRVTTMTRPASSRKSDIARIAFRYDDSPAANGLGRLTGVTTTAIDGSVQSQFDYRYDTLGNRSRSILTIAGESLTTQWVFDPQNREIRTIHPDGTVVNRTFAYGNMTHLLAVGDARAAVTIPSSGYTALGAPTRMTYGNGVVTTLAYSPGSWPLSLRTTAPDGRTLLDLSYTWSALGQILSIAQKAGTTRFVYDTLRLGRVTGRFGFDYVYDDAGNLTTNAGVSVAYRAHQAISGKNPNGTTAFTAVYDDCGNLGQLVQAADTWTYLHDAANRLVEVRLNGAVVQDYAYDFTGRRISRRTHRAGGIVETKVYPTPTFERVSSANPTRNNVYLLDPLGWAGARTLGSSGASHVYFHRSHNGSTLLATDDGANTVTDVKYQPYGQLEAGSSGVARARPLLTGMELDEATGLYYFGARYYHPGLARFVEADPELGAQATRQDATNRYAYLVNDPVNYTDMSGNVVGLIPPMTALQYFIRFVQQMISWTRMTGKFDKIYDAMVEVRSAYQELATNDTLLNEAKEDWQAYNLRQQMQSASDDIPDPDTWLAEVQQSMGDTIWNATGDANYLHAIGDPDPLSPFAEATQALEDMAAQARAVIGNSIAEFTNSLRAVSADSQALLMANQEFKQASSSILSKLFASDVAEVDPEVVIFDDILAELLALLVV